MKRTTIHAAIVGLVLVIASAIPTSRDANPAWTLLKRGAHLRWDPPDAYLKSRPRWRKEWERLCHKALLEKGCEAGIMHMGMGTASWPSRVVSYVNVEGESSTDNKTVKKMRVFDDGSSADGWLEGDLERIKDSKRRAMRKQRAKVPKVPKGRQAHILWEPLETYQSQPKRKEFWERRCNEALAEKGCSVGVIHTGAHSVIRNGRKAVYVNVEGASSSDKKNAKRMRVFEKGPTEDDWSEKDLIRIRKMKRMAMRPKKGSPHVGQGQALIWWDPRETYSKHQMKKLFWESRCDRALSEKGCSIAVIHKGETRATKNGQNTSYVNVEAASLLDMGNLRKLRVYGDGSSEDFTRHGWTEKDLDSIRIGKIERAPKRRRPKDQESTDAGAQGKSKRPRKTPMNQESTSPPEQETSERPRKRPKKQGSTSTQAPTHASPRAAIQEASSGRSQGSGESQDEDSATQAHPPHPGHYPERSQSPGGSDHQSSPTYSGLLRTPPTFSELFQSPEHF